MSVRNTLSHSTGKWYAEFSIDAGVVPDVNVNNAFVGLQNSSASLSMFPGSDTNGWGYYNRSQYYHNYGSGTGFDRWGTGDVVMLMYDADAGTMKWGRNGNWAANTVTGVAADLYLALGTAEAGIVVTLRTKVDDFDYPIPAGYSEWG